MSSDSIQRRSRFSSVRPALYAAIVAVCCLVMTDPSLAQTSLDGQANQNQSGKQQLPATVQDDPRYGLLSPLPETGGIPAVYDLMHGPSQAELEHRAKVRNYEKQFRQLKREHFRSLKTPQRVREGLEQLKEFTDPASFVPMLEVFADSPEPIVLAIFDHLAAQGEHGHAALAWYVITNDGDEADERQLALCNEATMLLSDQLKDEPTPQPVLQVLDQGLRSPKHQTANNAGALAGAINAVETIPLLIFAQATRDNVDEQTGDLAWIAIQTQTVYVANVQPVLGDDSGAFQPVLGVLNEGVVLRVLDAVAINYRTYVHRSLVAMTTHEWGQSTEHLAYDMRAWWQWYNSEYVPYKNEQLARARLAERNRPDEPPAEQP